MKRLECMLFLTALAGFPHGVSAASWAINTGSSITLNQSAFSNNWAGSETGNVTWAFMSQTTATKPLSARVFTNNTLKLYYGQTEIQDRDTRRWGVPVKSTDLIELESVFRFTLGGFLDPFVSGRVDTFFSDQRDSTRTFHANPLTLTETLGLARAFINEKNRLWTARLGFGLRESIDRNFLDPVTLERQSNTETEGGFEFVNDFHSPLAGGKATVLSKLIVFQAVANSKADELRGRPGANFWKAPDVNWENTLTANITKYLIVNLYTQFLYDKQISRGGRFKQTVGLGLAYTLVR